MHFYEPTSPRNIARIVAAQVRSNMRNIYERQHDVLLALTPEVEQRAERPATQYICELPLFSYKTYRAMFNIECNHQYIISTYVITNSKTGSVYVGSTNSFFTRWRRHAEALRRGDHHNAALQDEFDKYGEEAFMITLLDSFDSTDGLLQHEEDAALRFDMKTLLNFRLGSACKPGWNSGQNKCRKVVRTKRGPNTKARWFDHNKQG